MDRRHAASVVVVAYGAEPYLLACIEALLTSLPATEIIVVDNGANDAVSALPRDSRLKIVVADRNLGFAGGCNLGAAAAAGDVLVFVNSDVVVQANSVSEIERAVRDPSVAVASGSIRLAAEPMLNNSCGNPVHFLGFSWVGGYREPAVLHQEIAEVASISGAMFAVRATVWQELGGFDPAYFAYGEDVDLSLRAWQAGYRVVYVPQAVSFHHYNFSRNQQKMYLLERNRLITVLTNYQTATLARIAPIAFPVELAVLAAAIKAGWGMKKLRSWGWIISHPRWLAARRREVQRTRRRSDSAILQLLTGTVDVPLGLGPRVPAAVNRFMAWYWQVVCRAR